MRIVTRYATLMFFHLVGSTGHVVQCSASGAQNVDALFFLLGWDHYRFHKNSLGHLTPNMFFCIQWYLRVM
jgi:hypothetical protein